MPDANWKALRRSMKRVSTKPRGAEKPTSSEHLHTPALVPAESAAGYSSTGLSQKAIDQPSSESLLQLFPHYGSDSKFRVHIVFTTRDPGKYVAIDCEMVGVGPHGIRSILARVSIVNYHGHVLLDAYVKPLERVTDYREKITGIKPWHLTKGETLTNVINQVNSILENRIVVGHGLSNDFKVLMISISRKRIRDTSTWKPLRKLINCHATPSLKKLTLALLNVEIQTSTHNSVEDARAAMLIYRKYKAQWDSHFLSPRRKSPYKMAKEDAAFSCEN